MKKLDYQRVGEIALLVVPTYLAHEGVEIKVGKIEEKADRLKKPLKATELEIKALFLEYLIPAVLKKTASLDIRNQTKTLPVEKAGQIAFRYLTYLLAGDGLHLKRTEIQQMLQRTCNDTGVSMDEIEPFFVHALEAVIARCMNWQQCWIEFQPVEKN